MSYYFRLPKIYAESWRIADKELTYYLKTIEDNYDSIIIDSSSQMIYTSFLFYSKYSANNFLKTVQRYEEKKGTLLTTKSFGKYQFRAIDWEKDTKRPKTLIITKALIKPKWMPAIQMIYHPTKYVVLSVNESIIQYPISEAVYAIIDTVSFLKK